MVSISACSLWMARFISAISFRVFRRSSPCFPARAWRVSNWRGHTEKYGREWKMIMGDSSLFPPKEGLWLWATSPLGLSSQGGGQYDSQQPSPDARRPDIRQWVGAQCPPSPRALSTLTLTSVPKPCRDLWFCLAIPSSQVREDKDVSQGLSPLILSLFSFP